MSGLTSRVELSVMGGDSQGMWLPHSGPYLKVHGT